MTTYAVTFNFPTKPRFTIGDVVVCKHNKYLKGVIVGMFSTPDKPIGYAVDLEEYPVVCYSECELMPLAEAAPTDDMVFVGRGSPYVS